MSATTVIDIRGGAPSAMTNRKLVVIAWIVALLAATAFPLLMGATPAQADHWECGTEGAQPPNFGTADLARDIFMFAPCDGYILDARGGLHRLGNAPTATGSPYFASNLARRFVLITDAVFDGEEARGGYILDGYGALHPFEVEGGFLPPQVTGTPYFPNHDIARDLFLADVDETSARGLMLDGFGALHPFGGMDAPTGTPYFGFDIARGLQAEAQGDPRGLILDGFGALHPFGGAPQFDDTPYFGFDIARDLLWDQDAEAGYVFDGYGGLHPFGNADTADAPHHPYTGSVDTYRALSPFRLLARNGAAYDWVGSLNEPT